LFALRQETSTNRQQAFRAFYFRSRYKLFAFHWHFQRALPSQQRDNSVSCPNWERRLRRRLATSKIGEKPGRASPPPALAFLWRANSLALSSSLGDDFKVGPKANAGGLKHFAAVAPAGAQIE
jgi:hypothetical protein